MATISELLNEKLVKQLGATIPTDKPTPDSKDKEGTMIHIDELKLKDALVNQAQEIRMAAEDDIIVDIFADDLPDDRISKGSKLLYVHPDVGGVEVLVDIEHLIPEMTDEKYKSTVKLIEDMADVNDRQKALAAYTSLMTEALNDEINILYVLFRKSRLFDFSHDNTRELLVTLVSHLCAYHLKGRALLKGILNQSTVDEHIELAIRCAGQIRAKEVLPEIHCIAKKENNQDFIIICLEAIINIRDTKAAIEFLPIINDIPATNNKLIGEAIRLSRKFEVYDDEIIQHLFKTLVSCNKRSLRPIYSEAIKSFGARAFPILGEFIRSMDDSHHVRFAARLMGGIRSPIATKTLRTLLKEIPNRQSEIIHGMAYTKDSENLPLILECLQNTTRANVKRTCITAISSIGDKKYAPALKKFLHDPDTNLDVIYALMRLGDKEAENMFFDKMLNGTPQEQDRLENFTSLLPQQDLIKVAKKATTLSDMDSVILLSALYKPNVLPKAIGPFLHKILNRKPRPAVPVRLAIYKIVGKFAGSEKELLGASVLISALNTEEPKVKRELEAIISTISTRKETGGVSTRQR